MTPREQQVLLVIAEHAPVATADVAHYAGISMKAAGNAVYRLRKDGHVQSADLITSPRGRYHLWRPCDWRAHFRARPDVAAAWIPRGAA